MRVLIVGAGAMGSSYGARLLQAGASVSFLVRERRALQLSTHGLELHSDLGSFSGAVDILLPGEDLTPFDLIVLTCKAYDLDGAVRSIRPAVGPSSKILPLLDGMQPYDFLDGIFGRKCVMGGAAYIAVTQLENGCTQHLGLTDRLVVGARAPEQRQFAEQVVEVLRGAAGQRSIASDIEQVLWDKWIMLCAGATVTCLMRGAIGQILSAQHGEAVIEAVLRECLTVAEAEGHPVAAESLQQIHSLLFNASSPWMASMARDIESEAPRIEAACIVGDMLARSELHGIPAPILKLAMTYLRVYELRRDGLTTARSLS